MLLKPSSLLICLIKRIFFWLLSRAVHWRSGWQIAIITAGKPAPVPISSSDPDGKCVIIAKQSMICLISASIGSVIAVRLYALFHNKSWSKYNNNVRCCVALNARPSSSIDCAKIFASVGNCAPSFTKPVGSIWILPVLADDEEVLVESDIRVIQFWHVNRLFYHAGCPLNSCRLRQCTPSYTIYTYIEGLSSWTVSNLT